MTWSRSIKAAEEVDGKWRRRTVARTMQTWRGHCTVEHAPIRHLPFSIADFVPCDRVMQRAFS